MNLPDSIQKITEEVPNDPFAAIYKKETTDVDEILFLIRQKITPDSLRLFDEGVAYYKTGLTDRSVLRNIIFLYCDVVVKQLRKSNIDDIARNAIISNFENTIKTLAQLFDYQQILINSFNQSKKIVDAEEISYIMLGYVIETLRKIYNSKSQ